MISLYAELNFITRRELEEGCRCKLSSFSDISEKKPTGILSGLVSKTFHNANYNSFKALYLKMIQYRDAEVALLSPAYLLQYNPLNHDTFVRSFEGIFLTEDTKAFWSTVH